MVRHWDTLPLGERQLEVRILERLGPVVVVRSTLHREYLEDLINFRVANEQGLPLRHLSKDAADRPNIDRRRILFGTE